MCECEKRSDDVRWLAMLLRQGMKLIVSGIEDRYDLGRRKVATGTYDQYPSSPAESTRKQ